MKIPEYAPADAVLVTQEMLAKLINTLDGRFGLDYAKKNPVLVAALVQTASYNFRTHLQSGVYDRP